MRLSIHGGAGRASTPDRTGARQAALVRIYAAAKATLGAGSALDAVVHAVRLLEDDPLFNAGLGSKLQIDGGARLSASLMDGATERFAGVVNVEHVSNPILLARHLLDDDSRTLAGAGALARARELGLSERDPRTPEAIQRWRDEIAGQTGTVGAVAVDAAGRLAAATSTGGRGMERVGRVSDSCTVAGNFADEHVAVSFTGIGEHIVDGGLAVRLAHAVALGQTLAEAADDLVARMGRRGWQAGFIAVDRRGEAVARFTTEAMAWLS